MPFPLRPARVRFRDAVHSSCRIEDVTSALRDSLSEASTSQDLPNWAGTENGFYIHQDGNHPGLLLHEELKYTLPPGQYEVRLNWQKGYSDVILTDVDVVTASEDDYLDRIKAIIRSLRK